MIPRVELLAPAKDRDSGLAALDSGADAIYIGGPQFGARAKAGNSLEDISSLVTHAHLYWARVYVTVNTLLYNEELPQAVRLIHQLYDMGVDAIIIQDMGLLEADLPPIALIASTQMHNHTPARIAFLERVGFRRVILARELSLAQIRAIRAQTHIELESFIHGALCVSYSGQCYMSYALGGRSGNRGECAQPCRRPYSLIDRDGQILAQDRHLLSLRDLNLSDHLEDLLDAGVTSFKIEGRLKDRAYVTNVVSGYRQRLDQALAARGWLRSSSGHSSVDFEPDLTKTFNRGYTTHFLQGRQEPPGALDSPKMVGEYLGTVTALQGPRFLLDSQAVLNNGDGLCWFDEKGKLDGTVVNAAESVPQNSHQWSITPEAISAIRVGQGIYRNRDHGFLRQVERSQPERKIPVGMRFESTAQGFALHVVDPDGNEATVPLDAEKVPATQPDRAESTVRTQLAKTGGTIFDCTQVDLVWDQAFFLPVSVLNALRRQALDRLIEARAENRPRLPGGIVPNDALYPEKTLTYRGNVLNRHAAAFYRRHGVAEIEPAAESGLDMDGRVVMRTRYCIQHQLGYCDGAQKTERLQEPLFLIDQEGRRYRLRFRCSDCEMEILYENPPSVPNQTGD